MNKKVVSTLKYLLSLALAFLLLYFAFRNIDLSTFWDKIEQVDYTWVILSIVLSLLSYYSRAYRWNILLRPLGHPHLNVHRTNLAVLVGYLANLAFPRLGEVTRCGMMKRSDNVPMSSSIGTVITERVIDLLTLVLLIIVVLFVEYDRFIEFIGTTVPALQDVSGLFWKGIAAVIILALVGFLVFYLIIRKSTKIREFFRQLIDGVLSLRKIDDLPGFILSTLVLWVTYYFMSYLIVFSLPETADLTWMVGVMLLVTGGLALVVPVQGGIGTYHVFISSMLALYAVEKTTGVFLATLLHTSQLIAMAVFGGIALVISIFLNKQNKREHNPS